MLYEMIGIVRPGNLAEIKEIVTTVGNIVLNNGGVVRSLANWGVYQLPRPISRHQMTHRRGHHFVLRYDSSPAIHAQLRQTMTLEPRVIHTAHVKLGNGTLEDIARFGKVDWRALGEGGAHMTGSDQAGPNQGHRQIWEGRPAGKVAHANASKSLDL
jgi:ribosomal protein S6